MKQPKPIEKLTCPPCANKKRLDRLADHIAQRPFTCPQCNKVWVYKVDMERKVEDRLVIWYYASNQHNRAIRTDAI